MGQDNLTELKRKNLGNTPDVKIIEHMEGNICRCGTYLRIVAAIRDAGAVLRGAER